MMKKEKHLFIPSVWCNLKLSLLCVLCTAQTAGHQSAGREKESPHQLHRLLLSPCSYLWNPPFLPSVTAAHWMQEDWVRRVQSS